jgi:non-ribosomal peptide synthetase component E (peptide arylation enzyme)
MNLVDVLLNSVRRYPEKLALVCGDTRLSYRAFNERCNRLANCFNELGIVKEDHVAILSKNCHRLLSCYSLRVMGSFISRHSAIAEE